MKNASSVLFCCDHNSIRSPMAEMLMKRHIGTDVFVQSAGIKNDKEIDGYAVAVCDEIGIDLMRHEVRSIDDLEAWGDDLQSYDLIIALSPVSFQVAKAHVDASATEVIHWPIDDPAGLENREAALVKYRAVRDDILARIQEMFPR